MRTCLGIVVGVISFVHRRVRHKPASILKAAPRYTDIDAGLRQPTSVPGRPEWDMAFVWNSAIGDPTLMGWVTVALYLVAAVASCAVALELDAGARAFPRRELHAWRALAVLLFLLAVNKQLDLQSTLTEMGRYLAQHQGWYEARRNVQIVFVVAVAAAGIALLVWGFVLLREVYWPTRVALFGGGLVLTFVVIRAASFHHVDAFFSGRCLAGMRWNAVLEMAGPIVILVAAGIRLYLTEQAAFK